MIYNHVIMKKKNSCGIREMKVKITDDKVVVETIGEVRLYDFARYMIMRQNITRYSQIRKCPYMIYKNNIHGQTQKDFKQEFRIKYLLPNDTGELQEFDNLILHTEGSSMSLPSNFECYIIDLLEVLQDRKWVKRIAEDRFEVNNMSVNINTIEYVERDLNKSPSVLRDKGYIVPKFYEDYYNGEIGFY